MTIEEVSYFRGSRECAALESDRPTLEVGNLESWSKCSQIGVRETTTNSTAREKDRVATVFVLSLSSDLVLSALSILNLLKIPFWILLLRFSFNHLLLFQVSFAFLSTLLNTNDAASRFIKNEIFLSFFLIRNTKMSCADKSSTVGVWLFAPLLSF